MILNVYLHYFKSRYIKPNKICGDRLHEVIQKLFKKLMALCCEL